MTYAFMLTAAAAVSMVCLLIFLYIAAKVTGYGWHRGKQLHEENHHKRRTEAWRRNARENGGR